MPFSKGIEINVKGFIEKNAVFQRQTGLDEHEGEKNNDRIFIFGELFL